MSGFKLGVQRQVPLLVPPHSWASSSFSLTQSCLDPPSPHLLHAPKTRSAGRHLLGSPFKCPYIRCWPRTENFGDICVTRQWRLKFKKIKLKMKKIYRMTGEDLSSVTFKMTLYSFLHPTFLISSKNTL